MGKIKIEEVFSMTIKIPNNRNEILFIPTKRNKGISKKVDKFNPHNHTQI